MRSLLSRLFGRQKVEATSIDTTLSEETKTVHPYREFSGITPKDRLEISALEYYEKHLEKSDAEELRTFIPHLAQRLRDENPLILAIGSSTWPQSRWDYLQHAKDELEEVGMLCEHMEIPTTYKNINLLVIPQAPYGPRALSWKIRDFIEEQGTKATCLEETPNGWEFSYHIDHTTITRDGFAHVVYGFNSYVDENVCSVETTLANSTSLNIRTDTSINNPNLTHLECERKRNLPMTILHYPS